MIIAVSLFVIVLPWVLGPVEAVPTKQIVSLSGFYDTTPSRHPLTFKDIHGTYSRFMELSDKENLCPRIIKHLTNGIHNNEGIYIPHKDIRQDGATCRNNGNLSLKYRHKMTSEDVEKLFGLSPHASGFEKSIRSVLLSINGFYIGVEHKIRSCGDSSFAPDTTVLITSDSDPFGQHFGIPFHGHPKILLVKYGQTACAFTSSWASPEPISVEPTVTDISPKPVAVADKPAPKTKPSQNAATTAPSPTPSATPSVIVPSQSPRPIVSSSASASPSATPSLSSLDTHSVSETKDLPKKTGASSSVSLPNNTPNQESTISYPKVQNTGENVSPSPSSSISTTVTSPSRSPSNSVIPPRASPSYSAKAASPSVSPSSTATAASPSVSPSSTTTAASPSASTPTSSQSQSSSATKASKSAPASPSSATPTASPSVSTTAKSHGNSSTDKKSAIDMFPPDAEATKKQFHNGAKGGAPSVSPAYDETATVGSSSSPSASVSNSQSKRDDSSIIALPGGTIPDILSNVKGTPRATIYPDASKAPKIVDFVQSPSPSPNKRPPSGLVDMFASPSKASKEGQHIDLGMKPKPSKNSDILLRTTPSPSATPTKGTFIAVVEQSPLPTVLPSTGNPVSISEQTASPSPSGKLPLIVTNPRKTPSPSKRPMTESKISPSPMAVVGTPEKSSTPSPQNSKPVEEENDGSACFPASASVIQIDGTRMAIEELAVGDHVFVGHDQYSRVIDFSHADRKVMSLFDRFFTEGGHTLTVTPSHYIYTRRGLLPASLVTTNDSLVLADGRYVSVIAKDQVVARGLFNPHTTNGDIVVDGFLVSTYTSAVKPVSAHALMAPIRLLDTLGIHPTVLNSLVQHPLMIRYFNIRSS